jgi:hypothetical protein
MIIVHGYAQPVISMGSEGALSSDYQGRHAPPERPDLHALGDDRQEATGRAYGGGARSP